MKFLKKIVDRYSWYRGWRYVWGWPALRGLAIVTYQRARYGIARSDAWSLDDFLTRVTLRGLEHLMENLTGYPAALLPSEYPPPPLMFQSGVYFDDFSNQEDKRGMEKWKEILMDIYRGFVARQMLGACIQFQRGHDGKLFHDMELEDRLRAASDKGMALFVRYYDALWD